MLPTIALSGPALRLSLDMRYPAGNAVCRTCVLYLFFITGMNRTQVAQGEKQKVPVGR
jgi:hypothetical protein